MKYFAKLNETNKVINVVCVNETDAPTEVEGIAFLTNLHNYEYWKESFKDGSQRKNGASKGYTYNPTKDAFISPKPYPSWVLNETTCKWEAPSAEPTPTETTSYFWNEETVSWNEKD